MIKSILLVALTITVILMIIRFKRMNRELLLLTEMVHSMDEKRLNWRFRYRISNTRLQHLSVAIQQLVDRYYEVLRREEDSEQVHRRMIANITHDIQTPLTAMIGYVEAVLTDNTLSENEKNDYLNVALDKSRQIQGMFRQFFELSRLESEEFIYPMQPIDLILLIEEIILYFRKQLRDEGIREVISVPDGMVMVWGDSRMIERILFNLVSNAIRYGKSGMVVEIIVRLEEQYVWIDVMDRGPGILPSDLPYIFDRLYIGETSRNSKWRGSGLGLAITKQLVRKMKGELTVKSTPFERTVFSVSLQKFSGAMVSEDKKL